MFKKRLIYGVSITLKYLNNYVTLNCISFCFTSYDQLYRESNDFSK